MAGFADLVRNMVAVADALTATLQATVQHFAWSGATKDAYGKVTWAAATPRQCVVEPNARLVREDRDQPGNVVTMNGTRLTFPRPVAVDTRDRFQLPSGAMGLILDVEGVTDPGTNAVYATEVFLKVE